MDKHSSDRGKKSILISITVVLRYGSEQKIAHLISVLPNCFQSKIKKSIVSTRPFRGVFLLIDKTSTLTENVVCT